MLEDKIDALIKALDRNTNTMLSRGGAEAAEAGDKPAAKAAKKPAAKPAEDDTEATTEIPYTEVQKAVANLANMPEGEGKGKPAVKAILATFKVAKAQELKPEQYADFIKALNDKAAEEAEEVLS